ncbi:ABC transporter permease [Thermosipho atlanticus]|uniref:NitT/TauT family transport system permease protein n=1 Tax=Thermosipho atlanticus DSM 15807 TaxID=1123380 RepID=A0A1M5TK57_9BACT|nr:ABC transporter permease [Thermosipho atlanticus]SHH51147.1 NitT/TauT family transport system permease protein [Thermosipho atlanticus DSM 15807]
MRFFYGILIFIITWGVLSFLINSPFVLPTPIQVGKVFIEIIQTKILWTSLLSSIYKGIIALFLTIILGFIFGFFMGICDMCFELLRPIFAVFQTVPVISWLVLVIFLWGISSKGPIFITVLSLLPNTTFAVAYGVRNTDKSLLEMAKVFNVSKKKIIKNLYFGSVIPFILTAFEVVSGNLWKVIFVSEYLCGKDGIGVQIAWARQYVDVPKVYALTIFAVILGILSERLSKFFINNFLRDWEYGSRT